MSLTLYVSISNYLSRVIYLPDIVLFIVFLLQVMHNVGFGDHIEWTVMSDRLLITFRVGLNV